MPLGSGARRKAAKRARASGEFENTKNTRSLVEHYVASSKNAKTGAAHATQRHQRSQDPHSWHL